MRVAVITVAGISSRFNEGIPENEKVLKAIYSENGPEDTLLYRLLRKCAYADRIVVVGGYQFEKLYSWFSHWMSASFPQAILIRNEHYEDLASGYSLYLGLQEALGSGADEVLFVEGDLDIDETSFRKVVDSKLSVLTYTSELIYANKAVVLYQNRDGQYKYVFNSEHGLLRIEESFSCILNSGQVWKFTDAKVLRNANEAFYLNEKDGTNLRIIQRYIQSVDPETIGLIGFKRWTNCNTREDYHKIRQYWRK